MIQLAIRLAVRSGREALVRLAVITAAVGIGVGLLLSVLAIYQGYQASVAKACWQCTDPAPGATSGSLLWNYSRDMYQGRGIDRLDVATLSPAAPVVPGLAAMPAAGQFYASPALATLLATVPADELGDRYPGRSPAPSGQPVCRARTRSRSSSATDRTRCAPYLALGTSPPSTRRRTGCQRRSSTSSGSRWARSRCWYPWPF